MPVYDYVCKDCNKTFEKIHHPDRAREGKNLLPILRQQERGAGGHCIFCGDLKQEAKETPIKS